MSLITDAPPVDPQDFIKDIIDPDELSKTSLDLLDFFSPENIQDREEQTIQIENRQSEIIRDLSVSCNTINSEAVPNEEGIIFQLDCSDNDILLGLNQDLADEYNQLEQNKQDLNTAPTFEVPTEDEIDKNAIDAFASMLKSWSLHISLNTEYILTGLGNIRVTVFPTMILDSTINSVAESMYYAKIKPYTEAHKLYIEEQSKKFDDHQNGERNLTDQEIQDELEYIDAKTGELEQARLDEVTRTEQLPDGNIVVITGIFIYAIELIDEIEALSNSLTKETIPILKAQATYLNDLCNSLIEEINTASDTIYKKRFGLSDATQLLNDALQDQNDLGTTGFIDNKNFLLQKYPLLISALGLIENDADFLNDNGNTKINIQRLIADANIGLINSQSVNENNYNELDTLTIEFESIESQYYDIRNTLTANDIVPSDQGLQEQLNELNTQNNRLVFEVNKQIVIQTERINTLNQYPEDHKVEHAGTQIEVLVNAIKAAYDAIKERLQEEVDRISELEQLIQTGQSIDEQGIITLVDVEAVQDELDQIEIADTTRLDQEIELLLKYISEPSQSTIDILDDRKNYLNNVADRTDTFMPDTDPFDETENAIRAMVDYFLDHTVDEGTGIPVFSPPTYNGATVIVATGKILPTITISSLKRTTADFIISQIKSGSAPTSPADIPPAILKVVASSIIGGLSIHMTGAGILSGTVTGILAGVPITLPYTAKFT